MIIGGMTLGYTPMASTIIYNTKTRQFTSSGNLNVGQFVGGCETIISSTGVKTVISVMGSTGWMMRARTTERWTQATGWQLVDSAMPDRWDATTVSINNRVYLIGAFNEVHVYDEVANVWVSLGASAVDPYGKHAFAIAYNL